MNALTLNLNPVIQLTDEQFFQLCQINELIRFERNADGTIVLMPLVGGLTSIRNANITAQLGMWNRDETLGVVFDSSTGFTLPNSAVRSPDASWIKLSRWDTLQSEEKEKFPPICPDFVIELLSPSDSLKVTQKKMKEYQENGVRLGWLINRKLRQVEVYRIGQEVEILENPSSLSGEDVLPGFVLDLEKIW
ncbi:MAG: Uma2 family endonuclease [Calothrix sp. MO_167.B12]|nr:Uma2 family endonuclease [Calothrix sp. MO_167.B12]